MIPFDKLNQHNHEISELSQVLSHIISDRKLCDTTITCELFERFGEKVRAQFDIEDKSIYSPLLNHKDKSVNSAAFRSLNSSHEIKRIFNKFMNTWCRKGLNIKNHDQFVAESNEMFTCLLDRQNRDTEEFYPILRRLDAVNSEETLSQSA